MNILKKRIILLIFILLGNTSLFGNDYVGTIIKKQGDVKIFTNPGKKIKGSSPHVLFNNMYYSVKKGRLGLKIKQGNIVQTGNKSKARIVFKNGDQFNIGEGTAYKINWRADKKSGDNKSVIGLMRGTFRAIISKNGPRNNLEVKTKYASMGVRGTDFFVRKRGAVGAEKVVVLRGKVQLKVKKIINEKKADKLISKNNSLNSIIEPEATVDVVPGFSAKVVPIIAKAKGPNNSVQNIKHKAALIKIDKATKKELVKIQKSSVIKLSKKETDEKNKVSKSIKKELLSLEQKAFETTIKDIKDHDPKLYAKISKSKVTSVSALNREAVRKVYKVAPKAPEKPGEDDLEKLEENAYEKYFESIL